MGMMLSFRKYRRDSILKSLIYGVVYASFWVLGSAVVDIGFFGAKGSPQNDQPAQTHSHAEASANLFYDKQQKQSEIDRLKAEITGLEAEVTRQYTQLTNQRKQLNSKADVEGFNSAAADYSKNNQVLAEKKQQLERLWKELDGLNAQSDLQARSSDAAR